MKPVFRYSFSNGEFTQGEGGEWNDSFEPLEEAINRSGYIALSDTLVTGWGFHTRTYVWSKETNPNFEYAVRVQLAENELQAKVILVRAFPDLLDLLARLSP